MGRAAATGCTPGSWWRVAANARRTLAAWRRAESPCGSRSTTSVRARSGKPNSVFEASSALMASAWGSTSEPSAPDPASSIEGSVSATVAATASQPSTIGQRPRTIARARREPCGPLTPAGRAA